MRHGQRMKQELVSGIGTASKELKHQKPDLRGSFQSFPGGGYEGRCLKMMDLALLLLCKLQGPAHCRIYSLYAYTWIYK